MYRTVILGALLILGLSSLALSQSFVIPLRIADSHAFFDTLRFGLHPDATSCMDGALGEHGLPPKPPSGIFDVRFTDPNPAPAYECYDGGMKLDLRKSIDSTQSDVYLVEIQASSSGYPVTISWPDLTPYYSGPVRLKDALTGSLVNIDMKAQNSIMISQTFIQQLRIVTGTPDTTPPPPPPPQVLLSSPLVDQTSIRIDLRVNPEGSPATAWIEWGTTTSYGNSTPVDSVGSGSSEILNTHTISGLAAHTTYHLRGAAQNAHGTAYTADVPLTTFLEGTIGESFFDLTVSGSTAEGVLWLGAYPGATYCIDHQLGEEELPPKPPSVVFDARLTDVREGADACHGQGMRIDLREYVGPSQADTFRVEIQAGEGGFPVTLTWPNLGAWFTGAIVLKDDITGSLVNIDMKAETSFTATHSFLNRFVIISGTPGPPTAPPEVSGSYFRVDGQSTAVLMASVYPKGSATTAWFEWGQTAAYDHTTASHALGSGPGTETYTEILDGLLPGTFYHFRAVAQNAHGTVYGADLTIITLAGGTGTIAIPLNVHDQLGYHGTLYFGVHPKASTCIDDSLGEGELPPKPPSGVFDARLTDFRGGGLPCLGQGVRFDLRHYDTPSQIDSYMVEVQSASGGRPFTFTWPDLHASYSDSVILRDDYGFVNVDMKSETTYTLTQPFLSRLWIYARGPVFSPQPPVIAMNSTGLITAKSADLWGYVNPNGYASSCWFEWGPTGAYGNSTPVFDLGSHLLPVFVDNTTITGLTPGNGYHYRLKAQNEIGLSVGPDQVFSTATLAAAQTPGDLPGTFALLQNYPNPFNPETKIRYQLPSAQYVTLRVYNVFGQLVRTLVEGTEAAGFKSVDLQANGLPSGVYFYSLTAGDFSRTQKMLLMK